MTGRRFSSLGAILIATATALNGSVALALPFSADQLTGASKVAAAPSGEAVNVSPGSGSGTPISNPEPASLLLVGSGLAGLAWLRRRVRS